MFTTPGRFTDPSMSWLVLSSFLELEMSLSGEVLSDPPKNFPRSTLRFSPGPSLLFLFFIEVLSLNENNNLTILKK
ncbi:hypothetical protein KSP40_PGU002285 [Platanthera guangdongensis]|uniref:Uncharacterized protein n=1 Tax=Platanthera guangdongensis TaxID=2320717 RepID=A0ABR2N225_9ASPA